MKAFLPISKVEERSDGTLFVSGIASTEALDVQGEIVTADAMKSAMPDFFKYGTGNLREMHGTSAAGIVEKATVEDGKTYIECIVVDPVAVKKVQTGTYKGFSIGGRALSKSDKTITSLRLSEISLVDRPANPEAVISMWKADAEPAANTAIDALAELLNKGDITPERLVELAGADMAKAEKPADEITKAEEPDPVEVAIDDLLAKADDIAKAGAELSGKNKTKLQAMHDTLKSMGVDCGAEKHDHTEDLAKADAEKGEALTKLADAESTIAKLNGEMDALKGEITKLKAMPAPGKALLNAVAVSKSEDVSGEPDSVSKAAPIVDAQGEHNDVASLIKMIHSKGGVIVR